MNDNNIPPTGGAPIPPMDQARAQEMILTNFIWPVLCCAVNGLRLSLPQVPIPHMIVTTCGLFGKLIGITISQGSLADVLKIRGACIQAFAEGVRGVKPEPAPMPQDNNGSRLNS